MGHLGVLGVLVRCEDRHLYRGENLVLPQSSLIWTKEKLVGRHGPGAATQHPFLALDDELSVHHRQDRREVCGRVGMGDVAADRPAVPYLRVSDAVRGLPQDSRSVFDVMGIGNFSMGGKRADAKGAVLNGNSPQFLETTDVDKHRWLGQAQFHHGDEAVSTGQDLGAIITAQKLDSIRD